MTPSQNPDRTGQPRQIRQGVVGRKEGRAAGGGERHGPAPRPAAALAVRLHPSLTHREHYAFVALIGGPEVRVRVRFRAEGDQWRCDVHGGHRHASCWHELAAQAAITGRKERTSGAPAPTNPRKDDQ